jgi:gliding motility-associated-like protein
MKQFPLLIILLMGTVLSMAQPCGLTDTLAIPANSSPTYAFEVFNIFNDDLSNPDQGICGVEIFFIHQFVDNLEISLTSPAGQTVELIGPNTDEQFSFTPAARWRITFVPCSDIAEPDPGFLPTWSNNQPNNFAAGGQYSGSYYPFSGCLEDFNTGTVNGTWNINVTNDPSGNPGAILGFRLLFCDERGLDCCFAASGDLSTDDNVLTCIGDSSLVFDIDPIFNGTPPDSNEYGYTYIIGEDELLLDYDSMPDLTAFPPGNYQICGFSYKREDIDSFWIPNGIFTIESLRNNLDGLEPDFCGEVTDTCIWIEILLPPDTTFLSESICVGDSLMIADTFLTDAGIHYLLLESYASCDSIVAVDLSTIPIQVTEVDSTICEGDSVVIGPSTYLTSGTYADTLQSITGCDSIVNLMLSVLPPVMVDTTLAICAGDTFVVGDSMLTETGVYEIELIATTGCDSLVRVDLSVIELEAAILSPDTLSCMEETIVLDGSPSSPSGLIDFRWLNDQQQPIGNMAQVSISNSGWYYLEVSRQELEANCLSIDSVFVNADTLLPLVDVGVMDTINCVDTILSIGGSGSSTGIEYTYLWTTNTGSFVSNNDAAVVDVNAAGTYMLTINNIENGCVDSASLIIVEDITLPTVDAGTDTLLNCAITTISLDGSGSSQAGDFSYEWISTDGVIPTEANTLFPMVDLPGEYRLIVRNENNGCVDSAFVNVGIDTLAPFVSIANPVLLNCSIQEQVLDASASDSGPNFTINWEALSGGVVIDNINSLTPTIGAAGVYELSIQNEDNGCEGIATTEVRDSVNQPIVAIIADGILSCSVSEVNLDTIGISASPDIEFCWSTLNGQISGDTTLNTITVSTPGTYQLTIKDTVTQCFGVDSIEVLIDSISPIAEAGTGFELNCSLSQDTLFSTGSSQGINFAYEWMGPCIISNTIESFIEVDCPGTYFVSVTNMDNGCMAMDSVIVTQDENIPVANTGDNYLLTCDSTTITLDGSASSQGVNFTYEWSGPQILSGQNSLFPIIGQPGAYTLTVLDTLNTCLSTASTTVFQDTISPIANAGEFDVLTCDSLIVQIGGSETSMNGPYVYEWTSPNGHFLSPTDEAFVLVDSAGDYQLMVENTINGCRDTSMTTVFDNTQPPLINAGVDDTLDCANPSLLLGDGTLPTTINLIYEWSGPCLLSSPDSTVLEIDCEGQYILSVLDAATGCTAIDSVLVSINDNLPQADLPADTVYLSCTDGTISIDASASTGAVFTWLFNDQPTSFNDLILSVDSVGTYTLIAENTAQDCADTASIIVLLDCTPDVIIADPTPITCAMQTITLDASLSSSDPNIQYEWTAPQESCIVNGQGTNLLEVSCGGEYSLIVTNTSVGLSDTTTVEVPVDTIPPLADAGIPDTLTCDAPTALLDGSNSTQGTSIGYVWTQLENEFFVDENIQATVTEDGIYFLTVIDSINGCTDEDVVIVQQASDVPEVNFNGTVIPCLQDSFWLETTINPQGPDYTYTWTGDVILEGADSSSVLLDTAGIVSLTVVNPNNNCTVIRNLTIVQQTCVPCLEILPPDSLTCLVDTVTLSAFYCEPCDGCTINWSTSNGTFLSNTDNLEVLVGAAGTYTITATDTLGFSEVLDVIVSENLEAPMVDAGPDIELECDNLMATIGTPAALDSIFQYQWTAVGSNTITNDSIPQITVSTPDTYILAVSNLITGCTATDEVLVSVNTFPPIADAGDTTTLNCTSTTLPLDGGGSTFGSEITYEWNGPPGGILAGTTSFNPVVNAAGWYTLTVTDTLTGCFALDSVLVVLDTVAPPLPVLTDTAFNCGNDLIFLNGEVPPGDEFTFCWYLLDDNGNVNSPCVQVLTIDVSLPGSYRFEVTNNTNNCSSSIDVAVGEDFTPPIVDVGPDLQLPCNTDSLSLSAVVQPDTVPIVYSWVAVGGATISDPGIADPFIYEEDTYILTTTNTYNQCTASDTLMVILDENTPTAFAGSDTSLTCLVSTLQLQGTASTISGDANLLWTTMDGNIVVGHTSLMPFIDLSGTYVLSVTDPVNGCIATDTVWVLSDTLSPVAVLAGSSLELNCATDSILLDATPSLDASGQGLTYNWLRPPFGSVGQADSIWLDNEDEYALVVTDIANGCKDTLLFMVGSDYNLPTVDIADPTAISCAVDTVVLDASSSSAGDNFSNVWINPEGLALPDTNLIISVSQPGDYTLMITNTSNGCVDSIFQNVAADTLSPSISILPPEPLDCVIRTSELDGSQSSTGPVFSYNWIADQDGVVLSGADSLIALAGAPGVYSLIVTNNENGCTAVDDIALIELAAPIEEAIIDITPPSCAGRRDGQISIDSLIGGTAPYLISLDGGAFSDITEFDNVPPGNYNIQIEDSNGCQWELEITVPEVDPLEASLGADTTIYLGGLDTLTLEVNTTSWDSIWWWPTDGMPLADDPLSYVVSPEVTTVYLAWVSTGDGCATSAQIRIKVEREYTLFAPNVFSPNGDGANDQFTLFTDSDVEQIQSLRIFDRWGNLVFEREDFQPNDPALGWDGNFNGEPMDPAVFAFIAEIHFVDGRKEFITGDLVLMR